jgi:hypothetical protein
MKKLNSVIYNKLLLQAKEAKSQEMTKLSSAVMSALGPMPEDEPVEYNYQQLKGELYDGMWKLATHVIKYYDVKSADVNQIHDRLETLADQFLEELETSLGVEDVVAGPLESPLPGERTITAQYHVIKHKKDNSCPKCEQKAFCQDCGVCSDCSFTTTPR